MDAGFVALHGSAGLNTVHAFGDDALGGLDGVGVVKALKNRQVSVPEVVEAAIARANAVNPILNGLAYGAFDRAVARASASGGFTGFFGGLPSFIQECEAVAGMPTMGGTDGWKPQIAVADGKFACSYLAMGIVPLGLTRMSEFGFNATAEHPRLGAVRNPWNPDYTAGGSSSGSAAFVAAGVVPIAHGIDAAGSIRIPASCNGLVGLKPSRGRLPLDRALRLPVGIVEHGVLTRSVRDTAAFFREAERFRRDQKLPAIGDISAPGRARLRVAVCTRSAVGECSPEVRDLTLKTAALLEELGHRVEHLGEAVAPPSFLDDFVSYGSYCSLLMTELPSVGRPGGAVIDRDKLDNLTLGLARHGDSHLHRMPVVIARLEEMRRVTARFYRTYDVVLTPTLTHETPRLGHLDPTAGCQQIIERLVEWTAFNPQCNVTGEPAISLPLAESASGMPVGMMLAADVGQEARLLELAYELEDARPWRSIQGGLLRT